MYQNIIDLIEDASKKYGYRTFSVDPAGKISFRAVRDRARTAGKRLKALSGTKASGYPIAIFGEKSNLLLTMMFASVYAGAFYVVLNPEQPEDRLNQILKVLDPKVLIVSDELSGRAQKLAFHGRTVTYGELSPEENSIPGSLFSAGEPAVKKDRDQMEKECRIDGDSPLYGIFTSGSTGTPKCVLISHRDVLDFIGHFAAVFHFSDSDVIGNQAPFDFDVSVKDIYTALFCGASLVLIPREYFSTPPRLLDYICDHGVTSLTWAVSALCIISGLKGFSYRIPTRLKRVMFSGEVMPLRQFRIWRENVPDAMYVNLYGPTEITCNCMYYVVPDSFDFSRTLPLGTPFPGRKVTLRDSLGHVLTSPGSRGEICVSGESLAIGYYHNPEQTRAHFRAEHVPGSDEERVYHTGDMAEIGADGNWYFSGRKDFQIKYMGHRIELEEIEKDVETEPGIERCVCSYDSQRKRITAFYTGNLEKKALHIRLKQKLPQYMIPNRFQHVSGFALNKNGKIDRKKLDCLKPAE